MARRASDDLAPPTAPALDLARQVGERLRACRLEHGWTLAETAQGATISVSYLSAIEKGNNLPSLPILSRVVGILGLSLNEVLRNVSGEPAATRARLRPERIGTATLSGGDLQLTVVSVVAGDGTAGACPVPTGGTDVFVYAIEGTIEVAVDSERFSLQAGDSLDAEAPKKITYRVVGTEHAVTIWAAAPSAAVPQGEE